MASQTGKNFKFAAKVQSVLGTAVSGSGATGFDLRPCEGMKINAAQAASQLVRRDGMMVKPRQGSRNVTGSYESELIWDADDDIIAAGIRGTWTASADITNASASLGSATITGTGTTITAGGGSWITAGVRVGMMCKFASMSTAANNGVWFPVLAVTASVITTITGLLTDQALDASFTLTLARQVISDDPPTERYYTIEQYLTDIDLAWRGQDCKFHNLRLGFGPDQPVSFGFDITGRDADLLAAGSSPNFTTPTFVTANPLYLADGACYFNGAAVANIVAGSLNFPLGMSTQPIAGSRLSPDVFAGNLGVNGSFTLTVEDDTFLNYLLNETSLQVMLRFHERESDPKDFISVFCGNLAVADGFTIPMGSDGALLQTIPLVGGKDEGGATSGYAPAVVMFSTSAT